MSRILQSRSSSFTMSQMEGPGGHQRGKVRGSGSQEVERAKLLPTSYLPVTKQLNPLEVGINGNAREGDDSHALSESLSVLFKRSKGTLKHLRALNLYASVDARVVEHGNFSSLKVLCLDYISLYFFSTKLEQHLPPKSQPGLLSLSTPLVTPNLKMSILKKRHF